jgi:hypothetical protein
MLRSACLAALCITASGFTGTAPGAFTAPARAAVSSRAGACSLSMVAAGKPPGAKLNVKAGDFDINAPTKRVGEEPEKKEVIPAPKIETECDADYGPLLKALQNGEWELADQLTRDMLIWIGGPAMRKRNFVYFAEAKKLPLKDMRTIDNLWTTYSKGKFGYSVQRQIWNSKKVNGDFNKFVTEIDWNKGAGRSGDTGILRRWLPIGAKGNEFVYDLKKAKKGHLPLTSALRGVYLLTSLLSHPAFGSGPMAGQVSAVQAAVVEEKGIMVEEARFDRSPYYKNKKPWDN